MNLLFRDRATQICPSNVTCRTCFCDCPGVKERVTDNVLTRILLFSVSFSVTQITNAFFAVLMRSESDKAPSLRGCDVARSRAA